MGRSAVARSRRYLRSGSDLLGSGAESKGDLVKVRLLATVAALVLSLVVGCHFASRNPPSTKSLQVPMKDVLTQSEISQSITLAVGNTLVVELGSNYTTPYRWAPDTTIGDSAIIKQLSHEFVPPSSDALGAPGTEMWTFAALRPGGDHRRHLVCQLRGEGRQTGVHLHPQRGRAISPCGGCGYATATWRCRA